MAATAAAGSGQSKPCSSLGAPVLLIRPGRGRTASTEPSGAPSSAKETFSGAVPPAAACGDQAQPATLTASPAGDQLAPSRLERTTVVVTFGSQAAGLGSPRQGVHTPPKRAGAEAGSTGEFDCGTAVALIACSAASSSATLAGMAAARSCCSAMSATTL
jgi:hypothetical protein